MVTLEILKGYLNLDKDFNEDDELLITILNGVENAIITMTNGVETEDGFNDNPEGYPSRFDIAVLMMCAELYNRREMNITANVKETSAWNMFILPMTKMNSFG